MKDVFLKFRLRYFININFISILNDINDRYRIKKFGSMYYVMF